MANYSYLGKDPYLKNRWMDKIDFSAAEHQTNTVQNTTFTAHNAYPGLGYSNFVPATTRSVSYAVDSDEQEEEACCDQD